MNQKEGTILIIDDDEHIRLTTEVVLKRYFQKIISLSSPDQLNNWLDREIFDVVLLDMNFSTGSTTGDEGLNLLKYIKGKCPDTHIIMMTAYGEINLAVKAMKLGAMDFVVKPWDNKKLLATVQAAYKLSQSKREIRELKQREKNLTDSLNQQSNPLIGDSIAMQEVFTAIGKVAKTDANILILGENGTGKEVIARELHRQSLRKDKIFIHVDLGAVPETLFESELFGHEKGAFTDAREKRIGRFELANGGTLFLDEIGNLMLPLQAKLLSALQNREITRIGGSKPIPVDIRLISATNMPLHEMINQNKFRDDLLFRINTVEITVPPLRERMNDISLLAEYFLDIYSKKYNKANLSISPAATKKISRYNWPGNVRELQHIIERAVIMTEAKQLSPDDFMLSSVSRLNASEGTLNLEELEKKAIEKALMKHSGNLSSAAKELGLGRTTLYRKMEKYDL